MSALTANRPTAQAGGVTGPVLERFYIPVADNVHIFQGALVQVNPANGLAYPAGTANTTDTHTYVTVGRAQEEVDNTIVGHTAGGLSVEVAEGAFLWDNSGTDALTAAMLFTACYGADDHTVAHTSNSGVLAKAGVFVGIDPVTLMAKVQTIVVAGSL
jgi:hypothetical protein